MFAFRLSVFFVLSLEFVGLGFVNAKKRSSTFKQLKFQNRWTRLLKNINIENRGRPCFM